MMQVNINNRFIIIFIIHLFFCGSVIAQAIVVPQAWKNKRNPPLNLSSNRIFSNKLDSFYSKLSQLKTSNSGVVRIVHIGDSHIQADILTDQVRQGFQLAFGDAGRGLVFPFQLARSNAPQDIKASSNISWQYSRIAHKTLPADCGIAGFVIKTSRPGATINISLADKNGKPQNFKNLQIFTDTNSSWLLKTDSGATQQISPADLDSNMMVHHLLLEKNTNSIALSTSGVSPQSFYGLSVENDAPGVIYNTIGVNGARYDQYNTSQLFWQQLPALQADLYIVSMGTNEAQAISFDEGSFSKAMQTFIDKIKMISPSACILITTAVDSYRAGRPNKVLKELNDFIYRFTLAQNIPLWDQYKVTLGYGGSRNFIRLGLMQKDKVHFMRAAYELQGQLLLDALFTGYNNYISSH